jgi:hypothetical protein
LIFPRHLELVNLEPVSNLDRPESIIVSVNTEEPSQRKSGSTQPEFEVWSAKEVVPPRTGSWLAAFLRGLGSVLSIFPLEDYLPVRTDEDALSRDFAAVGEDLDDRFISPLPVELDTE